MIGQLEHVALCFICAAADAGQSRLTLRRVVELLQALAEKAAFEEATEAEQQVLMRSMQEKLTQYSIQPGFQDMVSITQIETSDTAELRIKHDRLEVWGAIAATLSLSPQALTLAIPEATMLPMTWREEVRDSFLYLALWTYQLKDQP